MGNSNKGEGKQAIHPPLGDEADDDQLLDNTLPQTSVDAVKVQSETLLPLFTKKVEPEWTWEIIGTMDFMELPAEVIDLVFSFMSAKQLGSVSRVSQFFNSYSTADEYWRFRFFSDCSKQVCLVPANATTWRAAYKEQERFATIQEAINASNATKKRIIIPAGVWNEALVIDDKDVELEGEEFQFQWDDEDRVAEKRLKKQTKELPPNDVTDDEIKKKKEKDQQIDVGRTVITNSLSSIFNVYKGKLKIKNLVLREYSIPPVKLFCVYCESGDELSMENCELSGQSLSCVLVRDRSMLRMKNCYISRAGQAGIFALNSDVDVSDSFFEFTNHSSILVRGDESISYFRNNVMRDMKSNGVTFAAIKKGSAVIENNTVIRSSFSAIWVSETAEGVNVSIRGNKLMHSLSMGLCLQNISNRMFIEDNTVYHTIKTACWASQCDVHMLRNKISMSKEHGMKVEHSKALIEENILDQNLFSGLDLSKVEGIVRKNQMSQNNVGIYVFGGGSIEILENEVFKNKLNGVEVRTPAKFKSLAANTIRNNENNGIHIVKALEDVQDVTAEQLKSMNTVHNNWNEDALVEFKDISKENDFHPDIVKMIDGEVDNRSDKNPDKELTEEIKEAYRRYVCTYATTGNHFHDQYWYTCVTCGLVENEGLCAVCKDRCHKGHQLQMQVAFSGFFCDCGASRACSALKEAGANETQHSHH
eukprot:TRINITY_DN474_c0_g1_i2.p1 TRINITY_DN474_c0_g1~~TRINITY_DN474_c0_g1_i2.p1  ORF type:complete len:704 (-),score=146.32 TRINITY_DN474_c0_g1_i2:103-2214(-)